MEVSKDAERKYHSIVAKAWTDKAFHDRLVNSPRDVFKEHGIDFGDHVDVSVKPGATRSKVEIPIPPKPAHMSDDDIKKASDDDPNTCGPFCFCW